MTVQSLTQFIWPKAEKLTVKRSSKVADNVIRDERGSIDYSYYNQKARSLRGELQYTFFRKIFGLR